MSVSSVISDFQACSSPWDPFKTTLRAPASEFSEILSIDTLTWSTRPGVPAASGYFAGAPQVLQLEDTFYIIGGYDNNAATDAVYEFDPESWSWKLSDERLTSARAFAGIVPIPNRLLTGGKR